MAIATYIGSQCKGRGNKGLCPLYFADMGDLSTITHQLVMTIRGGRGGTIELGLRGILDKSLV